MSYLTCSRSPSAICPLEPAGDAAVEALGATLGVPAQTKFEIANGLHVIAERKRHADEASCHNALVQRWGKDTRPRRSGGRCAGNYRSEFMGAQ